MRSTRWWTRAAAAAALVAGTAAGPRPALAQEHEGDGLLPPGEWTEEQMGTLLDLIDRTEAELPAFGDPDELETMGFIDFGITAPGGYDHFINWDWFDDEHILDPSHPESVVFRHVFDPATGEDHMELVSAMFFLPNGTDMTNIPADLAWMPGWHTHANVCVNDQHTFAGFPDGDGHCAQGHPFDKPPMLHVWIVDNECGHRFGGIDVGGLHCDVGHDDGHDGGHDGGHDDGHMGGADGMDDEMPPAAPPAAPVPGEPTVTG